MKDAALDLVDTWVDYSNESVIQMARRFENKGIPQVTMIVKFLSEFRGNLTTTRIHFLTGRYIVTKNIAQDLSHGYGMCFRFYSQHHNVSSRYFFSENCDPSGLIRAFSRTLIPMALGMSLEDCLLHVQEAPIQLLDSIGIEGYVNGMEFVSE